MNQLIIIAHPRKSSFNFTIQDTLINTFKSNGDQVKVRDLYEINFSPVLTYDELKYNKSGKSCPDIAVEQNYIEWADQITFIYPLWWNAFPAILKGYIDRVFTNGFAFRVTENGPEGLLKHKRVHLITSAGMDEQTLKKSNIFESLRVTQDHGVFEFCGMQVVSHEYITESTSLSDEEKKGVIERIIERVNSDAVKL